MKNSLNKDKKRKQFEENEKRKAIAAATKKLHELPTNIKESLKNTNENYYKVNQDFVYNHLFLWCN